MYFLPVFLLFFLFFPPSSFSQTELTFGRYKVGFCDTILFNEKEDYSQYFYVGKAPIFVKIWHPVKKTKGRLLQFSDFRSISDTSELFEVNAYLNKLIEQGIVDDYFSESATEKKLPYPEGKKRDILNLVKNIKTMSYLQNMTSKKSFPVIVYHHGSQGFSDENYWMAEYFATHGYIVLSANFHLPYEKVTYGLVPSELVGRVQVDQQSVKCVLEFARKLAKHKKVFYVGHSWGAQEGWSFLNKDNWADGFVSLETTIEFKSDTVEIKELWPELYENVVDSSVQFSIPILHFAATEQDEPFSFFTGKSNHYYCFSSKEYMHHNAFISAFYMRLLLKGAIYLPDEADLKKQLSMYFEELKIMKSFFESVDVKVDRTKMYSDYFYIN